MRREMFFAITGAVGMLFGIVFLLLPAMSLAQYGVPSGPHNVMQARYFGSALLAVGLVSFLARDTQDAIAIRAILVAGLVMDIAGTLISASAAGSLQNGLAWLSVAIYGAFGLGSAYYLFLSKPQVRAQSA